MMLLRSAGDPASSLKPGDMANSQIGQSIAAKLCDLAARADVMGTSWFNRHQGKSSSHQTPALRWIGKSGHVLDEVLSHG